MKQKTAGERIQSIRGEMSQADFGKSLESSQGAVSAWERDDDKRAPSAAIYLRLAALAIDPDDTIFFLQQAGLKPDVVVSVADKLFRKGDVKMPDTTLAMAEATLSGRMSETAKEEKRGNVFTIEPYDEAQRVPFQVTVPATVVSNRASTYYAVLSAPGPYNWVVGEGVAPGDIIVFDESETKYGSLCGEEVVERGPQGLSIGRLERRRIEGKWHLLITPVYGPPGQTHTSMIAYPGAPIHELSGAILGRLIARYPGRPSEFWRRQAGEL